MAPNAQPAPRGLLLFPCNGNALEALACLGSGWQMRGFVDDTPAKQGSLVAGHPVFSRAALREQPDTMVLAVPGSPQSYRQRAAVIDSLDLPPGRLATVIHPGAHISPLACIGRNVLILAGVVVTANAAIGDHVCILPNTVIHHDVVIGAHALIGSQVCIAGGTHIGDNAYIGSGSRLMNGLIIGARVLVGMGSVVTRDVAAGQRVAGCPAKALAPSRQDTPEGIGVIHPG